MNVERPSKLTNGKTYSTYQKCVHSKKEEMDRVVSRGGFSEETKTKESRVSSNY